MARTFKHFIAVLIPLFCLLFSSCNVEEPGKTEETTNSSSNTNIEQYDDESELSAPEFRSDLSHGDYDGVYFRCRIETGNDDSNNLSCIVHWIRYKEKPTTIPRKRDMVNHEEMRHYSDSRFSVVFDKAHAGPSVRGWLYYYFECTNSKTSSESDISTRYVRQNY